MKRQFEEQTVCDHLWSCMKCEACPHCEGCERVDPKAFPESEVLGHAGEQPAGKGGL